MAMPRITRPVIAIFNEFRKTVGSRTLAMAFSPGGTRDLSLNPRSRIHDASAATPVDLCGICGESQRSATYRSISPITISSDPTIAGTSAIKQPRQSSCVTERLQNELLLARTRQGIELPSL